MRRWTIDTVDDLAWFRRLAGHIELGPANGRPTTAELLAFLRQRPELERWQAAAAVPANPPDAECWPTRAAAEPENAELRKQEIER